MTTIATCIKELQDPRLEVRMKALQVLKDLQEAKNDITPSFSLLSKLIASEAPEERWSAADLLTEFEAKRSTGQWGYYASATTRLKKGNPNDKVAGANWLANITEPDMVRDYDERDISFAIPALAAAIFDANEKVGVAALEAISAAVGDGQNVVYAMPAVFAALKRCPEPVRRMASIVLRGSVVKGYDLESDAPSLWEYLKDSNDSVKMGVADALTYYFAVRQTWTEVEKLLSHPDKDVRQESVGTLAQGSKIKLTEAIPAIKRLLSDPSEEVRLVVARTLAKAAETPEDLALTLPIVTRMLDHAQDETRLYAANVLSDYLSRLSEKPGKEGVPPATSPLWQPLREIVSILQERAFDKNPRVKEVLARVLALYYLYQGLGEELVKMLQRMGEDDIRKVLNAINLRDSHPPKPNVVLDYIKTLDHTRLVVRCQDAAANGDSQLNLASNDLSAVPFFELPPEIGLVTTLTRLDLSHNLLPELPPQIGNLVHLDTLICSYNRLETLPPTIGHLTNLVSFYLFHNRLRRLPPEFGNLTQLKFLQLIDNELEELPAEFGKLQNLAFLEMENNHLRVLPPEIGQLKSLKSLDVRSNRLAELPPELANLPNLESISLCSNAMKTIPPVIFELKTLKSLSFSNNNLAAIPPAISQIKTLKTLFVPRNRLQTLPPEIGSLPNLESLDISNNQITVLPLELKRLHKLRWLDVHANKLDILEGVDRQCTRPAAILKQIFC